MQVSNMKLIREEIQDANFLVEEKGDKKNYFIEGVFMQSDLRIETVEYILSQLWKLK